MKRSFCIITVFKNSYQLNKKTSIEKQAINESGQICFLHFHGPTEIFLQRQSVCWYNFFILMPWVRTRISARKVTAFLNFVINWSACRLVRVRGHTDPGNSLKHVFDSCILGSYCPRVLQECCDHNYIIS